MTYSIRALVIHCGYFAFASATIFSPNRFWDVSLNLLVPLAVCVSLVLAFHFRSTSAFAFAVATATSVYIVSNYGGILFGDLAGVLLGDDIEALYFADIVYNHLCLIGGILGFWAGRGLQSVAVKQGDE